MKYLAAGSGWPAMKTDGYDISKPVHLAVDFDGPICANCTHLRVPKNTDSFRDWQCMAAPLEVRTPAERSPITGEVHEVQYKSRARCVDRNERGDCEDCDCEDFDRGQASTAMPATTPAQRITVAIVIAERVRGKLANAAQGGDTKTLSRAYNDIDEILAALRGR